MHDDDDLPPCVGERYVDVLAERAIALLADWDEEPPVRACARIADSDKQRPPKSTRGPQRAALTPFYRIGGANDEPKNP